jgi:hypothetical protein
MRKAYEAVGKCENLSHYQVLRLKTNLWKIVLSGAIFVHLSHLNWDEQSCFDEGFEVTDQLFGERT